LTLARAFTERSPRIYRAINPRNQPAQSTCLGNARGSKCVAIAKRIWVFPRCGLGADVRRVC
jgi:hypothetical protein